MDLLYIDIETYSSVDIKTCGAYKYMESPDFEILIIGYAFGDGEVRVIDLASGESMPDDFVAALISAKVTKVAHNAVFERLAFRRIGYDVPAEQWYCTMVKAAYCGLPLSLDAISKVLDLQDKKLSTGKNLIRYFSCPCAPTKVNGGRTRNFPAHAPEKWAMYKEYNVYDVKSEREIFHRLENYAIPPVERRLYALDQRINDRGILVDRELAEAAIAVDIEYREKLTKEAVSLTGLANPNSVAQLKQWVERRTGTVVESLSKEALSQLNGRFADNPEVMRLLDIRGRLSRTSVKKYSAMINCAMSDDRVRGTFQFYGANRTGRWAGRLLQLQNLSKNHISHIGEVRELVRRRDRDALEMIYGDVTDILSQLVRTALIAPKNMLFSVADFSAIEARVISWLADEKWRLDVFHGDGKIYEATGAKMFNVPISAITKGSDLRQKSKISELALGYEGGVGALERMGAGRMGITEAEMRSLVQRWRLANPRIVELWHILDSASKESVRYHRPVRCTSKNLIIDCDGEYMTVRLPSGRALFYKGAHFANSFNGYGNMPKRSLRYQGIIQATRQWGELDTYGGKLTENIVQAIARDILGNSMLNLASAGYMPVAHIHDECIVEVPAENAEAHYARMVEIMSRPPRWAHDLPLRADGYVTPFYLKD